MESSNLYNRSPVIDTIFGNSGHVVESINNLNKQIPMIGKKIDILNQTLENLSITNTVSNSTNELLKQTTESIKEFNKPSPIDVSIPTDILPFQKGGNYLTSTFSKFWNNKSKIIKIIIILFVVLFFLYVVSRFSKKKAKNNIDLDKEKKNIDTEELRKSLSETINKHNKKPLNYDPDD